MSSRRNFILGVCNGVFYVTGMAFTSATVVLPWYVSQLTQSNVLIGILPALHLGGWALPQLLLINYMQRQPRKLKFYRRSAVVRSTCWGSLALVVLLAPGQAAIVLPALIILTAIAALSGGFTGLAFFDVVGRIVPRQRLSVFFSLRNFFGGIGTLIAGLVVRFVLEQTDASLQPVGILFVLTWVFTTAGYLSFSFVKEPEGPANLPKRTFGQDLGRIKEIVLRDPPFRMYLIIRALAMMTFVAMPFYVVYGASELQLSAAVVASSAVALVGGVIGSNVVWGWLGARGGGWVLLVALTVFSVMPPVLALTAQVLAASQAGSFLVDWIFLAVFVFLGAATGGSEITFSVLSIEVSPVEDRIIYLGFTNTLIGILIFLTPVGGLLADLVSFEALFGLAMTTAVTTSVLAVIALRRFARRDPDMREMPASPGVEGASSQRETAVSPTE